MPIEAITCPQCGGADPSDADAHGVHRCDYCGVRYRLVGGAPERVRAAAPRPGLRSVRVVVPAVLSIVALVAAAIFTGRVEDAPAPAPSGAAPTPTPSPVSRDAPAPVPLTATFEQHSVAPSAGESFYVLGVVTNTSSAPIGKVELHVILLDASGEEVFADHGYGADDLLAPGQSGPLAALVSDPPPHASFRTEVEVRAPTFVPQTAPNLTLKVLDPAPEYSSSWRFSGSVTNDGAAPARFVEVRVTGWDAQDRLVGVTHTYATGKEPLAPGATARYATSHSIWADTPTRFETTVTGRVAD